MSISLQSALPRFLWQRGCGIQVNWDPLQSASYRSFYRRPALRREMHDLTGQTKAPSIDVDGHILADFGADELAVWWKKMGLAA